MFVLRTEQEKVYIDKGLQQNSSKFDEEFYNELYEKFKIKNKKNDGKRSKSKLMAYNTDESKEVVMPKLMRNRDMSLNLNSISKLIINSKQKEEEFSKLNFISKNSPLENNEIGRAHV